MGSEMCIRDRYQGDQVTKIAFGAITAAVFFVGGLLWMRKGFIAKFLAAVMYLFPPCLVLVKSIQMQHRSIGAAVAEIPADIWITIGGLLLILVMVGALSYILKRGNVDSQ